MRKGQKLALMTVTSTQHDYNTDERLSWNQAQFSFPGSGYHWRRQKILRSATGRGWRGGGREGSFTIATFPIYVWLRQWPVLTSTEWREWKVGTYLHRRVYMRARSGIRLSSNRMSRPLMIIKAWSDSSMYWLYEVKSGSRVYCACTAL